MPSSFICNPSVYEPRQETIFSQQAGRNERNRGRIGTRFIHDDSLFVEVNQQWRECSCGESKLKKNNDSKTTHSSIELAGS